MSEECNCGPTQEQRDECPYTVAWRKYRADREYAAYLARWHEVNDPT